MDVEKVARLRAVERQVLWLSSWMIHNANHLRAKSEVKVGGVDHAVMIGILWAHDR